MQEKLMFQGSCQGLAIICSLYIGDWSPPLVGLKGLTKGARIILLPVVYLCWFGLCHI